MLRYREEREQVKNNITPESGSELERIMQKNGEILVVTNKSVFQQNNVHRYFYEGHFDGYSRNLLFLPSIAHEGKVRNPDRKDNYGFYVGKYAIDKYIYNIWKNMERRCYYVDYPHYFCYGAKGITVSEDFKCYSFFEDWYKSQWDGQTKLQIDKDVKSLGRSKMYSPETCILIPSAINTFISTLGEGKGIEEVHNTFNNTYCVRYRRKYKKINKNFKTLGEAKAFKKDLDIKYLEILLSQYNLSDEIKILLRDYVKVCGI